ncbi:hypothetical protein C7M84_018459 [Penaeus vannamei]|uniref:Ig-like domain-containing protein n=1 Tax=Penaeus vannamei TaxID=6689 RepID=A0A3R7PET5_PENVA|nr:uncharacterized protein LOC113823134 [Penaeus vannamei]ROT63655.1 hypothetical protein C7M84_018459 [Penaeus vannamei]
MSSALLSSIILFLFLTLFSPKTSLCQQDIVVLKLADGGTSKPHLLLPLHDHIDPEMPIAAPQLSLMHKEEVSDSTQDEEVTQASITTLPSGKRSVQQETQTEDARGSSPDAATGGHQSTQKPTESSPEVGTTTASMLPTELPTWTPEKPTTLPSSTNPSLSTVTPAPPSLCHQECLAALDAIRLHPHTSLTLRQGSELTLQCEVPLAPPVVMESVVWLYQSDDIAKGQCALTPKDFIPACQGFQTISHINDRNATLIKDTIGVGNLQANYSGQYMCQVQITCCPQSDQEHVMNHELSSRVTVWLRDYTIDLAITGSLAVGLVLLLTAGSIYLARQNHGDYVAITDKTLDVKPMTVLHIPLVDDQDNDSFDSNFDEQE